MPGLRFAAVFVSLLAIVPRIPAASTYTCTVVPLDPALDMDAIVFPMSLNNQEQIAGVVAGSAPAQAFFLDNTGLSIPYAHPAGSAIQVAANDKGQVAGWTGGPGASWNVTSVRPDQQPAGFLNAPDGSTERLDPPVDSPVQTFGEIRVSGINNSGNILGEIGVTEDGAPYQYWFIRDASGIYTLFDRHRNPGITTQRLGVAAGPLGSINNQGIAVLGDRIRYPDGSETPITSRASSLPWVWYGMNSAGFLVGNFSQLRYTVPFSVLLTPDGDAPAIVCPDTSGLLAFSINDAGAIALAPGRGGETVLARPTGLHAGVELSFKSWGFSPTPVGQDGGSGLIYLTSNGKADLNIEALVIGARDGKDNPGDFMFTLTGTTCGLVYAGGPYIAQRPVTLVPGETCAISFTFSPQAVGARTAQIVVFDDAPDAPHVIRLDGTGLGKQQLVFSDTSWMFGAYAIGQTSDPGIIYIYNPGTDPINNSSISITGANASDFRITGNTCGATFVPYSTCAVSFVFAPAVDGARVGGLTFVNDSPVSPQTIPMEGFGYAQAQ